jgi:hypothetical protein
MALASETSRPRELEIAHPFLRGRGCNTGAVGRLLRVTTTWAVCGWLVCAVAGCLEDPPADDTGSDDVPRASCDVAVGGVPLSQNVLEAEDGYDEALEARDTSGLPATLDLSGLDVTDRALIAYALEMPLTDLDAGLVTSDARARGSLGLAVLASFTDGAFDLDFFRRGLHRFYACDRRLPLTLDGFETVYGAVRTLPSLDIALSVPKQGPRRIREDPSRHIYVAESLENGQVRETEIVMGGHRADGALDFLVYDAVGQLNDRSTFATVLGGTTVSASPYACLSCHIDHARQTYDVIAPFE